MKRAINAFFVLITLCSASGLWAQPLADRVPSDAIMYLGWSGSSNLPAAYNDSHLKAILDSSKLRELFSEFLPQWSNRLAAQDRNAASQLQLARTLFTQLWQHPTAIYFAGVDMKNPQAPTLKMALICQAGADAQRLSQQISQLLAQAPRELKAQTAVLNDQIVIAMGYDDLSQAIVNANSLKDAAGFAAAMKQVQAQPVTSFYLDFERFLKLVEEISQGNPEVRDYVPRIIEGLDLRGIKRFVCTSGFDGKDWMSQMFVDVPSPRPGILQAVDGKPVSADLLKAIPGDATFVSTSKLDLAKVIERLRVGVGKVNPQLQEMLDRGVGAATMVLGQNLQTDLLEPLGDDWAVYSSPSVSGNGMLGMVAVNRLDDAAKANRSFPIAWVNASNFTSAALQRAKAEVQVTGRTIEIDGMTINYLATPVIAPAWTIRDGNLYVGLYPQVTAASARWASRAGAKSFAENEKFIALKKRLGVSDPSSFAFYDLPTNAASGGVYQQLLMVTRYIGFSDLFGVAMPEPLLPPLDVLQQHLAPAGMVEWVDDAGWHVKAVSPFPGSTMFATSGMGSMYAPAVAAMGISTVLPSLNRARETANRVKCAANLKSMGQAMLLYANDHRGRYPATLGELLTMEITMEVFVCPSGSTEIPPNIKNADLQTRTNWVNQNSDYVYLGAGKTSAAGADVILIYEKPADHRAGMNMLYGDGHVDWNQLGQAMRMIQQQTRVGGN